MAYKTNRPENYGANTRFELHAFQTWATEIIFTALYWKDGEYAFFSNLTK